SRMRSSSPISSAAATTRPPCWSKCCSQITPTRICYNRGHADVRLRVHAVRPYLRDGDGAQRGAAAVPGVQRGDGAPRVGTSRRKSHQARRSRGEGEEVPLPGVPGQAQGEGGARRTALRPAHPEEQVEEPVEEPVEA